MTRTYAETVTLQEVTCKSCGITHAIPQKLIEGLIQTSGYYYCPNGHQWGWKESEADRLRKQLQQVETQLVSVKDQLQATEREVQRQKKRAANGVCPCCNRSFQQLHRHMKTQHPDYATQEKQKEGE